MNSRAHRVRQRWSSQPLFELKSIYIATACFVAVVVLCVIFSVSGSIVANKSAPHRIFENPNAIPTELILGFDAIIVLGGGAPMSLDSPPVYVQRRCDDAAEVWKRRNEYTEKLIRIQQHRQQKMSVLPILSLSAGTAHVPQLMSANGLPIWESTSSAAYLHTKHGIDYSELFVETASYDTIGNAYYTRTAHTDISGWRNLLIITNKVSKFFAPKV
jgi:uncharacterized SAM-binding protein YcdF (DUF218 family)